MVHPHRRPVALLGLLLAGCAEESEHAHRTDPTLADPGPEAADQIVNAPGARSGPFGDPTLATNGVRGGGLEMGSTDVFSLAIDGEEAGLTLAWSAGPIVDGPGPDIVVYENPFEHPSGTFMDPVVVELSTDGDTWVTIPHDYRAADETAWSSDPADWEGFAGLAPVLLHAEDNPTDPLDPEVSGGDGIDLAALDDIDGGPELREQGVCCIRLWSASAWTNPDTGLPFPRDPVGNGADIDGVYGRLE